MTLDDSPVPSSTDFPYDPQRLHEVRGDLPWEQYSEPDEISVDTYIMLYNETVAEAIQRNPDRPSWGIGLAQEIAARKGFLPGHVSFEETQILGGELTSEYLRRNEAVGERINGIRYANRIRERIQDINQRIAPEFEVDEVIDWRRMAGYSTQIAYGRKKVSGHVYDHLHQRDEYAQYRRLERQVGNFTPFSNTLLMPMTLGALEFKGAVRLGQRKMVDLGSGDGRAVLAFAMAGFDATGIEQEELFHQQAQENLAFLAKNKIVPPNRAHFIHGEFLHEPAKNSSETRKAIAEADVLFCYPWEHEIRDRLQLFRDIAKPDALFVFYGLGGVFPQELLDEFNMELVLSPNQKYKKWMGGKEGSFAPVEGAPWCIVRKKQDAILVGEAS